MPATTSSRPRTRKLIDAMLAEREEMLVLLWKISGRDGSGHDPTREMVQDFTSLLIDYIAAAHFGLYYRLAEGTERRRAVLDAASGVYSHIVESTRKAVAFNDRYEHTDDAHLLDTLEDDVADLAETLIHRIEYEDRIIDAMVDRS